MNNIVNLFYDRNGIEIGGQSLIFSKNGVLPIYPVVDNLDCCNFSNETIWEGKIEEGLTYKYDDKVGYRYICDATELSDIVSAKDYDFVITSNCLEHIANPLKSLNECLKIMKEEGVLLIVVPKKESNFDHNRTVTTFDHLKEDFEKNIGEDDLTHLDEILKLHDLLMDPWAGTFDQFKNRSLQNYNNRALNQHVFDLDLLVNIYIFFNIEVLFAYTTETDYMIVGSK
jgi:SAM-dependent methyltransferase